jgi:hypothetical protein
MKNCLSEKTLLLLHDGEGSEADRAHLESCLSCARRFRKLTDDIKEVVSILKQTPLPMAHRAPLYAGLRWSFAAAIVLSAFLLGRMTTAGAFGFGFHSSAQPNNQIALADQGAGDRSIGSAYGLYIDGLIGQEDDTDSSRVTAGDTWTTDSDGL